MDTNQLAKTVILSSALTLAIVLGLGYSLRSELALWLVSSDPSAPVVGAEAPRQLETREELVTTTIAAANPAVVSVVITKDVPVYERYIEEYNPFGGFFGGFSVPRLRERGTEEREVGGGSGFLVSPDGLLVTNRHVVADEAARYSVLTTDGQSYDATVVARDPVLDIAVLQLEGLPDDRTLPYLRFGESKEVALGQTVIAIGNALAEFRNSISVGVVSGLARSIVAGDGRGMSEQLNEVIQTDAAINPGNSGGPLLNLQGEVIGMNVAASLGAENIGFALPADVVKEVVDSVVAYGEIIRPYLGVRYAMVTDRLVEANDLPVGYGALIVSGDAPDEPAVLPGSPADRAGLAARDIILAVDGEELRDTTLAQVLRGRAVGDTIELRVLRDGVEETIAVTLERAS